ncbi:hypothetical protein [Endozoicomonas lisbonensis]|uniref:hypothetical protein n=1 Tax=Endozoicomonas lisbonensis TaxID=3120522 RepID=UPI0033942B31
MYEMENARQLLIYTRAFFKESLKSSIKTFSLSYGSASPFRKRRRVYDAEKSSEMICHLREHFDTNELLNVLHVLDPLDRAGNCHEYAMVAIDHGVQARIPNIWLVGQNLHQFLVLADSAGFNDLTVNEFCQYEDSSFWVCDPWFNIHCKMHLYHLMVMGKSTQWEHEGKEIYIDDNNTEPASVWSNRLLLEKMQFIKMTDSEGQPTDNWKTDFSSICSA